MATFLLLVPAPTDVPALGPSRADPARETGCHPETPFMWPQTDGPREEIERKLHHPPR
jgi:hypothetical protein